jgi:hypothetical protein
MHARSHAVTTPNRPPNERRPRTAPGAFAALLVFLASFGSVAPTRLPARSQRAPELTWSADARAPVGDVERGGDRPSNPAVRPRRGTGVGPWRTPTVLAALLLSPPDLPADAGRPIGTEYGIPDPANPRSRAPVCPRGPPPA